MSKYNLHRAVSLNFHLFLIAFTLLLLGAEAKLQPKTSNKNRIFDSIVIPSNKNMEQEAQKMYEDALQEYGAFDKIEEICSAWTAKGCICSESDDKVTLKCRSMFLNFIPDDLPENLIEL